MRREIASRPNIGAMDKWFLEEGYELSFSTKPKSKAMFAKVCLDRYLSGNIVSTEQDFASTTYHALAQAFIELAVAMINDPDQKLSTRAHSAETLIRMSQLFRGMEISLTPIRGVVRAIVDSGHADLSSIQLLKTIVEVDALWGRFQSNVKKAVRALCSDLLSKWSITKSVSREDCRELLQTLESAWIQRNSELMRKHGLG